MLLSVSINESSHPNGCAMANWMRTADYRPFQEWITAIYNGVLYTT
jgi:hypothetical protein